MQSHANINEEAAVFKQFLNDESINDPSSLEIALDLIENGSVHANTYNADGDTILHILARNNTYLPSDHATDIVSFGIFDETIARLVRVNKADINFHNNAGFTPLQCTFGIIDRVCSKTIMNLMSLGANPNNFDVTGDTILHWYVNKYLQGYTAAYIHIEELVQKYKVDINIQDIFGMTPLQKIMNDKLSYRLKEHDRVDIIFCLLNLGANPSSKDTNGNSVLHKVVLHGTLTQLKALLSNPHFDATDINCKNNLGELSKSPFQYAADNTSTAFIKVLGEFKDNRRLDLKVLALNILFGKPNQWMLFVKNQFFAEVVKNCLSEFLNGDTYFLDTLTRSTMQRQIVNNNMQEEISEYRNLQANIIRQPDEYLDVAIALIDIGVDANTEYDDGRTLMHVLVAMGGRFIHIIDLLAKKYHANMNLPDRSGRTPLQCLFEGIESFTVGMHLIMLGSNPADFDSHGDTILHRYVNDYINLAKFDLIGSCDISLCSKLIKNSNINMDIKNERNQTPLQLAMNSEIDEQSKIIIIFKGLLDLGADINTVDANGNTTLHLIMQNPNDNTDYLQTLFAYPRYLDINIKNDEGKTALDCAIDNGHMGYVELLYQYQENRRNDFMVLALNMCLVKPKLANNLIAMHANIALTQYDYLLNFLIEFHGSMKNITSTLSLLRFKCALDEYENTNHALAGSGYFEHKVPDDSKYSTIYTYAFSRQSFSFFKIIKPVLQDKTISKSEKLEIANREIDELGDQHIEDNTMPLLAKFHLMKMDNSTKRVPEEILRVTWMENI